MKPSLLRVAAISGVMVALFIAGCSRPSAAPAPATIAAPAPAAIAAPPGSRDVSDWLQSVVTERGIPGMTVVVLRGDEIVAQGAAGVRKAGQPERITLDDKFHLGSDTKAMTATLVGLLVDEGKLTWTTTLGDLFGDVVKDVRPEWKAVTVQQVLEHRAGLPANPGRLRLLGARFTSDPLPAQRLALVRELMTHAPEYPPGTKFLYSNTGYMLLGAVGEKITGRAWEDEIRARLFEPLKITTAGFGAPSASGNLEQPWGHHSDGSAARAAADNPPIYGPAGAAHMAIRDWAKFVALHLRGDPANPHREARLLRPETFAHLHNAPPGNGYIGGWGVATRPWAKGPRAGDIGKVLTHAGSNTMWFCVAWLAPESDFAVLVCANRGGNEVAKACDDVAAAMITRFQKSQGASK